jgi:hypothetical protein
VLTQRSIRARQVEVTVRMSLNGLADNQEAGLAHFAKTSCRLAVVQRSGLRRLIRFDQESKSENLLLPVNTVWLRSSWSVDGIANFGYSLDGAKFKEIGAPCQLSWGSYRGDRIGLYTFSDAEEKGYVEFRDFRYRVGPFISREPVR